MTRTDSALVSLIVLLSCAFADCFVEPVFPERPESPVFDETLITDNMAYFESLCVCVPSFDDVRHLDEDFYAGMVNMSILGPLRDKAESVEIEALPRPWCMDKISLTDMRDYALLLFGVELPAYEPTLQEMLDNEMNVYYEDGFYYIGWYDPLDIIYTYAGCEWTETGNLTVEFTMLEAVEGKTLFELAPADNENGFIIVSKAWQKP